MIVFDFDWSDPLNLVLILFLFLLGVLQTWWLQRNFRSNRTERTGLKIGLNLLMWTVITAFVLQPVWRSHDLAGNSMVVGTDVPFKEIKRIQDSLQIRKVLDVANFKATNFDTLTLVGQGFDPSFFARLSQTLSQSIQVRWIPYFADNQIQSISWKGLLRRGQLQRVSGLMNAGESQWVKLKFGDQTLDSVRIDKGKQTFHLSFPVFTEKRTNIDLIFGDGKREIIQFFAQPLPPVNFEFLLNNPDFESRNLATWLADKGNGVVLSTDLSKNIQSRLTLNESGKTDVIITDPKNASHPRVKKAFSNGKSILFINLTNPPAEVSAINASLGTKLQVAKISNEDAVPVSGEMTKMPFAFAESNTYSLVSKWPVAVEKSVGKVAVSLLNETFPVLLMGDSITYANFWTSVLAEIHPAYQNNMEVDAPLYKGIETSFRLNNISENPKQLRLGNDTLHLNYSAINPQTGKAGYIPTEASWLGFHEDTEMAVTDSLTFKSYYKALLVKNFVKARLKLQSGGDGMSKLADRDKRILHESRVPDWVWFMTLIFCFSALWLEPKFS
jgi:hypothetical protein